MQSPDALQDQVHWRGVREHEVEIDVEALLNHLCCDDDVTLGTLCGPLAKEFEHPAVTRRTLSCQEARVQQGRLLAPKHDLHRVIGLLRLADGIANNDSASAIS